MLGHGHRIVLFIKGCELDAHVGHYFGSVAELGEQAFAELALFITKVCTQSAWKNTIHSCSGSWPSVLLKFESFRSRISEESTVASRRQAIMVSFIIIYRKWGMEPLKGLSIKRALLSSLSMYNSK
jgi:hypothetical protein